MMNYKSINRKCEYNCHVFSSRVLGILPNKVASHFLRGDFVWQNAYLAKKVQKTVGKVMQTAANGGYCITSVQHWDWGWCRLQHRGDAFCIMHHIKMHFCITWYIHQDALCITWKQNQNQIRKEKIYVSFN